MRETYKVNIYTYDILLTQLRFANAKSAKPVWYWSTVCLNSLMQYHLADGKVKRNKPKIKKLTHTYTQRLHRAHTSNRKRNCNDDKRNAQRVRDTLNRFI